MITTQGHISASDGVFTIQHSSATGVWLHSTCLKYLIVNIISCKNSDI